MLRALFENAPSLVYGIAGGVAIVIGALVASGVHHQLLKHIGAKEDKPGIDSQGAWVLGIVLGIPTAAVVMTTLLAVMGWSPAT